MKTSLDLYLIKDISNGEDGGYLIATRWGTPVFGDLSVATWYTSMRGVKNAIARIKTSFEVRYVKARLEVLG